VIWSFFSLAKSSEKLCDKIQTKKKPYDFLWKTKAITNSIKNQKQTIGLVHVSLHHTVNQNTTFDTELINREKRSLMYK